MVDQEILDKIQELYKEGKEFYKMKQKEDSYRMPDAGSPAYIISKSWLDKYKKYCFYQDAKYNQSPNASTGHLTRLAPGPISNEDFLHTEDKFLKGTGELKGFEKEVFDTYLHKDKREKIDFEFISEELWNFLQTRYGCDQVVKRFYTKGSGYFSMT